MKTYSWNNLCLGVWKSSLLKEMIIPWKWPWWSVVHHLQVKGGVHLAMLLHYNMAFLKNLFNLVRKYKTILHVIVCVKPLFLFSLSISISEVKHSRIITKIEVRSIKPNLLINESIKGYIDGATTLLCIPHRNSATRDKQVTVKNGWLNSDWVNGTCKRNGNMFLKRHINTGFLICFVKWRASCML